MRKIVLTTLSLLFGVSIATAQTISVDASNALTEVVSGRLQMGNAGSSDNSILINNQFMTIGNKPVVPVMGEVHFSRCNPDDWEDIILKMKADGINVIASYVLWIVHEEIEGQFEWAGNRDLRTFAQLCQKHGLYFYPRIGPWCHAEIRNGGTPDWILTKRNIGNRTNETVYQYYATRWIYSVAHQLEGLMYKDGGSVIGIQIENEYRRGKGGEAHIKWLKETAIKAGFDVPMYTVTGWGNSSIPENEVIPLWGGYPDEPWTTNIRLLNINQNFFFDSPKNDAGIGSEGIGRDWKDEMNYSAYPYFTCELGVGNQLTYHRRSVIGSLDGLAIATAKTGAGSNLIGYYVFAGGSNPTGVLSSMEENRDETSFYNEYPDISYDFQAAITESGRLAPSYFELKKLHYFLNEYGEILAPMCPVFVDNGSKTENVQVAVRSNNKSAFVFAINYLRHYTKPINKNVRFSIKLENETVTFPSKGVDIADSSIIIWPVNMNCGFATLKYASAQPLADCENGVYHDFYFVATVGVAPEMAFANNNIARVVVSEREIALQNNLFTVSNIKTGLDNPIVVESSDGQKNRFFVLDVDDMHKFWRLEYKGSERLYMSDAELYINGETLQVSSVNNRFEITPLNSNINVAKNSSLGVSKNDIFTTYSNSVPEGKATLSISERDIFTDAEWIDVSTEKISSKNELNKVIVIKEFNIGNPSPIKAATMYLYSPMECEMWINDYKVNSDVVSETTTKIDFTAYLKRGDNTLMLAFPTAEGDKAFAAHLSIKFFNSDKLDINTDKSWLTTEQYLIPSKFQQPKKLVAPKFVDRPSRAFTAVNGEWNIDVALPTVNIKDSYLVIKYTGDTGTLYSGHRLASDNYNNGLPWRINLDRVGNRTSSLHAVLELAPLKPGSKILFDNKPDASSLGKISIDSINVELEYCTEISLE